MEIQNKLFSQKNFSEHSLMFVSSASRDSVGPICVEFYEVGLKQISSTGDVKTIEFDFDVKFRFSLQPAEIKFEKFEEHATYSLKSLEQVEKWRSILKNYLNQRGFHEQFTPFKKIGQGNFASVYLVEKNQDKKKYAVKTFSKQAAYSQQNGKQCLIKEIDVMRHLCQKNCMRLYEVFESQNSLYLVLQLLQGGELIEKIEAKTKFKPSEIAKMMKGILLGLKQMHSKGIMHRDLKPQNILFRKNDDWDCVIADFGLSEFSYASEYLFVRCGTPGYVAPQVIQICDLSTKYQPICDLFSLGLILFKLLTGRGAFAGKTYKEVLKKNKDAVISLNRQEFKNFSQETFDLLEKMLKISPKQRISAEDALKHPYFYEEGLLEGDQNILKKMKMHKKDSQSTTECNSLPNITVNNEQQENKNHQKHCTINFTDKQNVAPSKSVGMRKDNAFNSQKNGQNKIKTKINFFQKQNVDY